MMVFPAVVFWFGFEAILAQVLLLREFLVVAGGSELVLALFYGGWFAGVFLGAAGATWYQPKRERLARTAGLLLVLQAVWLCAAIVLVRCWRELAGVPQGTLTPPGTLAVAVAATAGPFGACTGVLFPLLCRLWPRRKSDREPLVDKSREKAAPRAIGTVYGVEAFGSFLGGAVTAFLVVETLRPLVASCLAAAVTTALSAALVLTSTAPVSGGTGEGKLQFQYKSVQFFLGLLAVALAVFPLLPLYPQTIEWSVVERWRSLAGAMDHVVERQTRYQQIDLGVLDEQYSLLLDGHFAAAFPDPIAAAAEAHLVMSQAPGARRVLLIGGAFRGILPELLLYPDVTVDSIELDPGVLRTVRPYLPPETATALRDSRVSLHWIDGRRFVKDAARNVMRGTAEPYDLVVSLAPDPTNANLNRYFTADYFDEVRETLRPEGVFVLRMRSAVNYFGPEVRRFTGSVYATLGSVFSSVLATPGDTTYLFASRAEDRLTSSPENLMDRYGSSGVSSEWFQPAYFLMAFEPVHTELTNRTFEAERGTVPLNTDARPVTYLFGLRLWGRISGSGIARTLGWVERVGPELVAAVLALLVAARLLRTQRGSRSPSQAAAGNALIVMVLTGGVGMAMSLSILFAFQNAFGFLYREVGILVGLFMGGLALGGLAFRSAGEPSANDSLDEQKRVSGSEWRTSAAAALWRLRAWQIAFTAFLVIAAITLNSVAEWGVSSSFSRWIGLIIVYVLMLAAGFMAGAEFPMVGHVQAAAGVALSRRSAWLESTDHLGAMGGAVLTGLVFVPRLGIVGTLLFLAGVKLASALLLLPPRGRAVGG